MTQHVEDIDARLDELWRELLRISKIKPMTLRRGDYRDGLFTAYCIMTGLPGEEVYELLDKGLGL